MLDVFTTDPSKTRFGEPAKLLPICFVCAVIGILWYIYLAYHCIPMLQGHETHYSGVVQTIIFNLAASMLSICYIKSIFTHPGTIPDDKDAKGQAAWEYVSMIDSTRLREPDVGTPSAAQETQETKRSGDKRHCKWCAKFKPDRCHHCRVCRTCILKMDHHCPWIYNCVGFQNHKYFFLLLAYSAVACQLIVWTMYSSLTAAIRPEVPFLTMFTLLFGESLAGFLAFMVTVFLCFHIWLMMKAMTTIEFCEKSMKRTGYDTSAFDRGFYGNIKAVLGDVPAFWFLPMSPPSGDGLCFKNEETPLMHHVPKDVEAGREIRKQTHEKAVPGQKHRSAAGTGECGGSDGSEVSSESSGEGDYKTRALPQRPV